ncbi:MAG TPA: M23 family metallopeptidase [Flavobacteriaceae bacterium]|nr:M23 family metallopeptidase [Flavobacteriaceae bacterium]MCB9211930.1 M23 family metallopeptidase [Alteromonas sp.]HPF09976.1 M23 family metallopeptidase [Flavobacteriaceae bacterium]HQU20073.1 M23 family metallopeptidase [Flavobacteriaceae bacterium]HQU63941.1 M23 family metallopeptidase [Flavobacteriaceae bacterium]
MEKKEKRGKKIKKKLLHKYRLVVLNEETFEERFSFKLNRLNVFVFSTIFALLLIAGTTLLIAFTPLREYIPGYSSTALKKKATELTYQTDSLQQKLLVNQQYIASIKKVLTGDVKAETLNKDSLLESVQKEVNQQFFEPSKEDSLLREKVRQEDKYNPLTDNPEINFVLFPPVSGTITEDYHPEEKHFAVDLVTAPNSPVKATADGTVIFAEWTAETGYVIIIKHNVNLISVYKHNASLTKSQGDLVKAGEVIAISGNTGEFTTGPHLHFELWSDGYPINPRNFIDFN